MIQFCDVPNSYDADVIPRICFGLALQGKPRRRDKVYALLGLVDDLPLPLQADYTKSLKEVFGKG